MILDSPSTGGLQYFHRRTAILPMRGLGKSSVVAKIRQALDVMFLKLRIFATTIEKLCMKEKESLIENKDQKHTEQEKDIQGT